MKIKKVNSTLYTLESPDGDTIEVGNKVYPSPIPYIKLSKWEEEVTFILHIPCGKAVSIARVTKGMVCRREVTGVGETIYVLDMSVDVVIEALEVEVTTLEIQQGEGKWIKFTVTRNGAAIDLSSADLFFGIKKNLVDADYVYTVENGDPGWDKTEASDGIVRASLPASQTKLMPVGEYDAQARFILTADTAVDKTQKLTIKIRPAVIND